MGHVSMSTAGIRSSKADIAALHFAHAKHNLTQDLEPPLSDKLKRQRPDVRSQTKKLSDSK